MLNDRECYWIDKYNMLKKGYNQNPGGDGGARTFGVNQVYSDEIIHKICSLLEQNIPTSTIALTVFSENTRQRQDYIGSVRRREKRVDISKDYKWDMRINEKRTISDETIHEICLLIQKGFSNKEISMKIFGDWNKKRVNYLTGIRKRRYRKDIVKKYDW